MQRRPPPKGKAPLKKVAKGPPAGRKRGGGAFKPAAAPAGKPKYAKNNARQPRTAKNLRETKQKCIGFLRWVKDIFELLEEKRVVMVREGGLMKKRTQHAGVVGAKEFVSSVRGFSFDAEVARTKGITRCPLSNAEVKFAVGPLLVKLEEAGKVPPKKDNRVRIGDIEKKEIPMVSWVSCFLVQKERERENGERICCASYPYSHVISISYGIQNDCSGDYKIIPWKQSCGSSPVKDGE